MAVTGKSVVFAGSGTAFLAMERRSNESLPLGWWYCFPQLQVQLQFQGHFQKALTSYGAWSVPLQRNADFLWLLVVLVQIAWAFPQVNQEIWWHFIDKKRYYNWSTGMWPICIGIMQSDLVHKLRMWGCVLSSSHFTFSFMGFLEHKFLLLKLVQKLVQQVQASLVSLYSYVRLCWLHGDRPRWLYVSGCRWAVSASELEGRMKWIITNWKCVIS